MLKDMLMKLRAKNKKHFKDTRIGTNRKLKQRRKKAQTSDRSETRRPSKNNMRNNPETITMRPTGGKARKR